MSTIEQRSALSTFQLLNESNPELSPSRRWLLDGVAAVVSSVSSVSEQMASVAAQNVASFVTPLFEALLEREAAIALVDTFGLPQIPEALPVFLTLASKDLWSQQAEHQMLGSTERAVHALIETLSLIQAAVVQQLVRKEEELQQKREALLAAHSSVLDQIYETKRTGVIVVLEQGVQRLAAEVKQLQTQFKLIDRVLWRVIEPTTRVLQRATNVPIVPVTTPQAIW